MKTLLTYTVTEAIVPGAILNVVEHEGVVALDMSINATKNLAVGEGAPRPQQRPLLQPLIRFTEPEPKVDGRRRTTSSVKLNMSHAEHHLKMAGPMGLTTSKLAVAVHGASCSKHQQARLAYALRALGAKGLAQLNGRTWRWVA